MSTHCFVSDLFSVGSVLKALKCVVCSHVLCSVTYCFQSCDVLSDVLGGDAIYHNYSQQYSLSLLPYIIITYYIIITPSVFCRVQ